MIATPEADRCPRAVIDSLILYIDEGVPQGDFLQAVIADKLCESVVRADIRNLNNLPHIAAWVYMHMPITLRGAANYNNWIINKAKERTTMPKTAIEHQEQLQAIKETAEEIGGKVYEGYSGRGMYGKECMGITCEDSGECIEVAAQHGLRGASVDSLGRKYIVYWRSIPCKSETSDD